MNPFRRKSHLVTKKLVNKAQQQLISQMRLKHSHYHMALHHPQHPDMLVSVEFKCSTTQESVDSILTQRTCWITNHI